MNRFLFACVALANLVSPLTAQTPAKPHRASLLNGPFQSQPLRGNRVYCGIDNTGSLCGELGDIYPGAFWPQDTPDNYIFGSGLQIAGVIPATAGGGQPTFAWAGDTVGAFFRDNRGEQQVGEALTPLFNSRDTNDLKTWPTEALVRDTALFAPALLGQPAASDQDLWVRYWDGNPRLLGGRTHPMGILLDQRVMAFTSTEDNQDIVYFVFTLVNVTARTPGVYANASIPADLQATIAGYGARFQDSSEARLSVSIPDSGYRLDSVYVAVNTDADVGDAGNNYSSVVLPFGLGMTYKANFTQSYWSFPLDIFGPPLAKATGFVGAKFLRSPIAATGIAGRIAMFSNLSNTPAGHPDPVGVSQLWRYLSGNESIAYGDAPCTFIGEQRQRHICFLTQFPADTRFYQSTGSFSLDPGQAVTVVMAYVFAAPTPDVNPYIGGDLKPGIPFPGDSIAADTTKLRVLERAAGWVTQADSNGDGIIEENEVTTVPRSLLDKARVAQAVADNRFLLPTAPLAPRFFLIPGDNQVTVAWQKSQTESIGDPYYTVANDPAGALYDPNYRQLDVEGYRIYRGRDPRALQLVAQLDYTGTVMLDHTGAFLYPGECAPELGVTTDCPSFASGMEHPIGGVVQVPLGGRTLVNGKVFLLRADTAVTGGHSGFPGLYGTGVSFVYTDPGVRNSFTYYYAVTAFDVNSIRSGRSSLESPRYVKTATPRASSGQETAGGVSPMQLRGADGRVLDPASPLPALDSATGIFSGPMPPTDGLQYAFAAFLPQVVAAGDVTLTVDSIVPGSTLTFPPAPATYFLTAQGAGPAAHVALALPIDAFSGSAQSSSTFAATATDQAQTARFGGDSTFQLFGTATLMAPGGYRTASWGRGDLNGDPSGSAQAGPRWWAGATNENTPQPNALQCTPASGTCLQADLSRNAGQIAGVTPLWHFQAYSSLNNTPMRNLEGIGATVARAADFDVYWGTNGAIDSVVDVTHHLPVPFRPNIRASWGILNDSSFTNTAQASTADQNNALLTWQDAFCVDPAPVYLSGCGAGATPAAFLMNHAKLTPVAAKATAYGTTGMTTTGIGFIFYLNGHWFMMQMGSLPGQGTVWHARFFAGAITGRADSANYAFVPATRPPAVPGLRARLSYTGAIVNAAITVDSVLARVHTVPDPYYVTDALEAGPGDKALKFVHLPAQAIIRIYSSSGILVQALTHNDPTGGGEATWNLRSRTGRFVASGVYFYHIETPDHHRKIGRFTIVTFRP